MRFGGLIAAIVFAAIAAVVVLRMSGGEDKPAQPQNAGPVAAAPELKTANIYVAAKPIPIGSVIQQDMLAVQPWPEHLVLPGFVKSEGGEAVLGTVARAPFQQQEPIIQSKLANPNDPNFLAGELPKGMRVITIQTNEIEGVAGFVFPGDHVDVMLTHDVEHQQRSKTVNVVSSNTEFDQTLTLKEEPQKNPVTETLLTNVKVLAVDQRASGAATTDKDGKLLIPRSVSLMVSPADAQRLRLAQKIGTVTLALRALADRESADPLVVTSPADVSQVKPEEITGFNAGAGRSLGDAGVIIYRGAEEAKAGQSKGNAGGAPFAFPTRANQSAPLAVTQAPPLAR